MCRQAVEKWRMSSTTPGQSRQWEEGRDVGDGGAPGWGVCCAVRRRPHRQQGLGGRGQPGAVRLSAGGGQEGGPRTWDGGELR
jgi:hypothetical protein